MWNSVAPAWERNADFVDEHLAAATEALLDAAHVTGGASVLELATGPGGAGLAAADRVGPSGHVLLADDAQEMVAVAARQGRWPLRRQHRGLRSKRDRRGRRELRRGDQPPRPDVRPGPGGRGARGRARSASRRTLRGDGLGPARRQSVARPHPRRGRRAIRRPVPAAGHRGAVLARRFRQTDGRVRSCRPRGRPSYVACHAGARRFGRCVVGASSRTSRAPLPRRSRRWSPTSAKRSGSAP